MDNIYHLKISVKDLKPSKTDIDAVRPFICVH